MINDIVAMTIPGFDKFVPFNELKSFLRDYIDIDDSICTGKLIWKILKIRLYSEYYIFRLCIFIYWKCFYNNVVLDWCSTVCQLTVNLNLYTYLTIILLLIRHVCIIPYYLKKITVPFF